MPERYAGPVVALYDFRGKQEFIYRTNKMREIIGASYLITEAYHLFLEALAQRSSIRIKNEVTFDPDDGRYIHPATTALIDDYAGAEYDGEVVYIGGGNLYMIYKNEATYVAANRIFSRMLLNNTYSLSVICACVPHSGRYEADRKRLYQENARRKNTEPVTLPGAILPFTELDRKTSLPIVHKDRYEQLSLSEESRLKRAKYDRIKDLLFKDGTFVLDDLTPDKGTESLLAVIYIDGNGLGERIKTLIGDQQDYPTCVQTMRQFSDRIQDAYVVKPIAAIEQRLREMQRERDIAAEEKLKEQNAAGGGIAVKDSQRLLYRLIVGGGDEITFICNARAALELLKAYFTSLAISNLGKEEGERDTACAGVAICHSHDPFSEVYKIAEECCETGKKRNRAQGTQECYMDFHFCHSGITNDLETIRRQQEAEFTARPYKLRPTTDAAQGTPGCTFDFERLGQALYPIGRANIKALSDAIPRGDSYYRAALERIKTRYKGLQWDLLPEAELKTTIFDLGIIFDIWSDAWR